MVSISRLVIARGSRSIIPSRLRYIVLLTFATFLLVTIMNLCSRSSLINVKDIDELLLMGDNTNGNNQSHDNDRENINQSNSYDDPSGKTTSLSSKSSTTRPASSDDKEIVTVEEQPRYSIDKVSMAVYKENDRVSAHLRDSGTYETSNIIDLKRYFTLYSQKHNIPLSELTFLDIGANIGWFTFQLAKFGVNVVAFEPMQSNVDLINESLSLQENIESGVSSRIQLHPHGLGVKDQVCIIYSHNINEGDGHVKCVEKESDLDMPSDYSVRGRIPVHRLDDVLDTTGMHIIAAKIDTEGYEANVFEGGSTVLLENIKSAILTEFCPEWIHKKGGDAREIMKKIVDAGFVVKKEKAEEADEYMSVEEMMDLPKDKYTARLNLLLHSRSFRKDYAWSAGMRRVRLI